MAIKFKSDPACLGTMNSSAPSAEPKPTSVPTDAKNADSGVAPRENEFPTIEARKEAPQGCGLTCAKCGRDRLTFRKVQLGVIIICEWRGDIAQAKTSQARDIRPQSVPAGVHAPAGPTKGRVYFISSAKEDGPVKIGFTSREVESRLKAIQTGHPDRLVILGSIEGNQYLEGNIHRRFAASRLQGEWFQRTQELLAMIAEGHA